MVISRLDWTARLEPECADFADCATEVRPAPTRSDVARDPLIGRSIGGRYRVLARIGQGNAGAVYLAEQIGLRRRVAIKLMLPQLTAAAEAVARFRREARVSSLARSEHVVEVMELGRLPEGALFLVMEYLGTRDVARLIAAEGALCVPRAAEIGAGIALGTPRFSGAARSATRRRCARRPVRTRRDPLLHAHSQVPVRS